jgi:hypothetical protein
MDTTHLTKNIKTNILEEIINSNGFNNSQKHQDLLRFLVEASENHETIKESTIAIHFFGKDAEYDASLDSSVRAYVSNLRKKLELYYLTEGKHSDIRLEIPKGHYHVEFIENKEKISAQKPKILVHLFYSAIILILVLLLTFIGMKRVSEDKSSMLINIDDPIWGKFFSTSKKTLIVLGDYYFFSLPLYPDRQNYIRDIRINSDEDLQAFISEHPTLQDQATKTYHKYLDEQVPWCLAYILPSLSAYNQTLDLKLSSEIQFQDIQRKNIIYIGSYKSLYLLNTIIRNLNLQYVIENDKRLLKYFDEDSNKVITYSWVTNPATQARNDYCIVAKVNGPNENTFLFFLSQHDFGNISTVRYFTNPENTKTFMEKIPSENFQALFEVTGIIRTDFDIKLINMTEIQADFHIHLD